MYKKRTLGIGLAVIGIFCLMTTASGNVLFQSDDQDLDSWVLAVDDGASIGEDVNEYNDQNFHSLKINSPSGYENQAYVTSYQMNPFDGTDEYWVHLHVFLTSSNNHWFYIFSNNQIRLVVNYGTSLYASWPGGLMYLGDLSTAGFDEVEIHANPGGGINYKAHIHGLAWKDCTFANPNSNGDVVMLGDDEAHHNGGSQNYGCAYFDSISIYHSIPGDLNDYDMLEDFAMNKNYAPYHPEANEWGWTEYKHGSGSAVTSGNYNSDDWDSQKTSLYIQCPSDHQAWATTPTFNNFHDEDDYKISCWFYIQDTSAQSLNFFHIVFNGQVNLVVTGSGNVAKLYYVLPGSLQEVCDIQPSHWTSLTLLVYPLYGDYDIYVENTLEWQFAPTFSDDNDAFSYLQFGVDTADERNFGNVWFDDIRLDQ